MNNEERMSKDQSATQEAPGRPIWITILAVMGILAVLFALGISVFQLATRGSDRVSEITAGLGGLFQRSERIVLTVEESTVNSEDGIVVSVEHRNKNANKSGVYTLEIDCDESITASLEGIEVECGEEIELGDELSESFSISILTENERYTDVPVIVRYFSGDDVLETDTLLTIVNTSVASTPTDGAPEKETPEEDVEEVNDVKEESSPEFKMVQRYAGRYSDPNGTADLRVTIMETGVIRNDEFRARNEVRENERAAVSFTISNAGTKETGVWYFSALLPTGETYYFRSPNQQTMLPGDRIEYILAFDDIEGRRETELYIYADPTNGIVELSETNNIGEALFYVR